MSPLIQLLWVGLLAIPVACIAWTVTHEDLFLELREYFKEKSASSSTLLGRKFFYLFTCEYCFSHYVTIALLIMTRFTLLFPDWRGYLLAGFSIVWIANIYMSLYGFLRVDLRTKRLESEIEAGRVEESKKKNTSVFNKIRSSLLFSILPRNQGNKGRVREEHTTIENNGSHRTAGEQKAEANKR